KQGLDRGRWLFACQRISDLLQEAAVHVRFVGDGQASLGSTEALGAFGRGVEILERASHVGKQRAAGPGERDVPGRAVEELDPEMGFELADCSRQRWWSDAKPL